jgi:hypothetical protein
MTIRIFAGQEPQFEEWKGDNPSGYLLNTHRSADYSYAKMHRVGCWSSEQKAGSTKPDPFTGQVQIKVCSEIRGELVDWVTVNRPKVTGNIFCARCGP